MNFGRTVKQEITQKTYKDKCCRKAFLAGVLRGSGKLIEKDGQLVLEVTVIGEQTDMLIRSLLLQTYAYEVRTFRTAGGRGKEEKTVLTIEGDSVYAILLDLDVFTEDENGVAVNLALYGKLTQKECCVRSFIRGLFLSSGSCTAPSTKDSKNTRYHLEIVFSHPVPAETTARVLLEKGVQSRIMRRKNSYVVYIKSVDEINNFFAFIGAPISVLKLMDLVATKEFVNNINRQQNCELANMDRQIAANEKYVSAINKIIGTIGLDGLKSDLRETARIKLEHPEYTLPQLANEMGVTKSCVNHRLRKILEIASEI